MPNRLCLAVAQVIAVKVVSAGAWPVVRAIADAVAPARVAKLYVTASAVSNRLRIMLSAKEASPKKPRFSPSLCVTHKCNLDCVYCYQTHDAHSRMSIETARRCLDWIFDNVPSGMENVEIGFIGGEPLLEFDLIREAIEYVRSRPRQHKYIFYATTNGTLLTSEMKQWCSAHRDIFVLALSLDGAKETHDYNRSNSFDRIDLDFFRETYPNQSVKMTLSEFSLPRLADNVKFVHKKGFRYIGGVNLCEGDFDWSKPEYIEILKDQLKQLADYYVENDDLPLNQMLDKHIDLCESTRKEVKKWCGIGDGSVFFDVDGTRYPCPFATPMTFDESDMAQITATNFEDPNEFIDRECFESCYLYPVCPTCAAANYLNGKSLRIRDKRRCDIQKLIAVFVADILARRIIKNPKCMAPEKAYYTAQAIKKIKAKYLDSLR